MALRAEALEFQPGAVAQLTIGDLLIQKLADSIISTPPTITPNEAGPFPEVETIVPELPAAGIFCPWCTARLQCAFHSPKHRSREALKQGPQIEAVRSNFEMSGKDQRGTLPHGACQSRNDPLSQARGECVAPKVHRNRDVKAQKSDLILHADKMNAAKWLNDAQQTLHLLDDETVSTALSCEETSYAESECSESSGANDTLQIEKHTTNIIWAIGSNWGIAAKRRGLN